MYIGPIIHSEEEEIAMAKELKWFEFQTQEIGPQGFWNRYRKQLAPTEARAIKDLTKRLAAEGTKLFQIDYVGVVRN